MLALIGGSGLSRFSELQGVRRHSVHTPYGDPSAPLTFGELGGRPLVFLARHGEGHVIPPHEINYRANLWALKEQAIEGIVAVAAVGGIRAEFGPGLLLVPHQILDYTWGRGATFFEGGRGPVTHIDFTEPYSATLRTRLLRAAAACGEKVRAGGVYATTQGPRLETAAEIDRLERDGADIVGMTGMPEAALARELGLDYATLAVVANHAAGRGESAATVSLERITAVLEEAMGRVRRIVDALVAE